MAARFIGSQVCFAIRLKFNSLRVQCIDSFYMMRSEGASTSTRMLSSSQVWNLDLLFNGDSWEAKIPWPSGPLENPLRIDPEGHPKVAMSSMRKWFSSQFLTSFSA